MKLTFDTTPQYIIDEYNLTNISHNGKDYIKIWKGMYGLPQSGIIAHEILKNTWRNTYINPLNSPQDHGPTNTDPYYSP